MKGTHAHAFVNSFTGVEDIKKPVRSGHYIKKCLCLALVIVLGNGFALLIVLRNRYTLVMY